MPHIILGTYKLLTHFIYEVDTIIISALHMIKLRPKKLSNKPEITQYSGWYSQEKPVSLAPESLLLRRRRRRRKEKGGEGENRFTEDEKDEGKGSLGVAVDPL